MPHFNTTKISRFLAGRISADDEAVRLALPREGTDTSPGRHESIVHAQNGRHVYLDPPLSEGTERESEAVKTNTACSTGP